MTKLPDDIIVGESEDNDEKSKLILFEDNIGFCQGSALHDSIRNFGNGLFSHWGDDLYFSTPDNSSPITNGRKYYVAAPMKGKSAKDAKRISGNTPVNYNWYSFDESKVTLDAEYAVNIAFNYLNAIPSGKSFIKGKSILELGPGINFATALIMRSWGARSVTVADRFLADFNENYHPKLYREVANILTTLDSESDVSILLECAKNGYKEELINLLESPLEELQEIEQKFDITLSNAVFEHLYNPRIASKVLYSIMESGAIGIHQVDFRDHRDFSRPLEFLLIDEIEFVRMFDARLGECGNRVRPYQLEQLFFGAGFSSVKYDSNMNVEPEYFNDFLSRLSFEQSSCYSNISPDKLRSVSGLFVVTK
ncbi:hypothetical protein [Methylomonas methanica]|uniref:hypothetical protein n=1 Tax=Methylomonas methanica TaxID=421 RepID=UPI0012F66EFF|nr:hypothetical protein [Methylomonas methanica]